MYGYCGHTVSKYKIKHNFKHKKHELTLMLHDWFYAFAIMYQFSIISVTDSGLALSLQYSRQLIFPTLRGLQYT